MDPGAVLIVITVFPQSSRISAITLSTMPKGSGGRGPGNEAQVVINPDYPLLIKLAVAGLQPSWKCCRMQRPIKRDVWQPARGERRRQEEPPQPSPC